MKKKTQITNGADSGDAVSGVNSYKECRGPLALEFQIEELVLWGFAPGDRFQICDAMERELARLIAQRNLCGFTASSVSVERLDGGSFTAPQGARAQALGARVAQAVFNTLENANDSKMKTNDSRFSQHSGRSPTNRVPILR
jgi:hypothetical protein